MKIEDLKKLCKESLDLYHDIGLEELRIDSGRSVLFKHSKKSLNYKKTKLKKVEDLLKDYSCLFETDVKSLKEVIWAELENNNTYLTIKTLGQQKINITHKELTYEIVVKNRYQLLLCRSLFSLPIIEFVSNENVTNCENTKINLLEEGFISSSKLKTRVDELERNIPGFQDLMWGIVEENCKKLISKNSNKQEGYTTLLNNN